MDQGYFITGTDTNVGKTWATVALMRYFKSKGKSVIGLKPVASGCKVQDGHLVNEDALLLQANASVQLDYNVVNPYAFKAPVSPHIAGKGNPTQLGIIVDIFKSVKEQAQVILVEGAGGWYSPINQSEDNCDLAVALQLPILLVVGIKLGCINHAKLSCQAIKRSTLNCAGWIAVCVDSNVLCPDENIDTLKKLMDLPLLGVLPFVDAPDFDVLAKCYSKEYLPY